MVTHPTLFSLTNEGLTHFEQFMRNERSSAGLLQPTKGLGHPVAGLGPLEIREFTTAREMAEAVVAAFGDKDPQEFADDTGLWSWLTVILADQVFPLKDGVRQPREFYRWFPAPPSDFQKAQRHLVRMPVLLFSSLGSDADHLLCGKPSVGPDIREQLTSQQDMFSRNFQQVCRKLYFDEGTGSVKKGVGSKDGPGTPRRLASVRRQLDVTWDMTDLDAERILELLPQEFDAFR